MMVCQGAFGGAHDKNLHVFGRAALPGRPRFQGRAAALPYHDGEDSWPAPLSEKHGRKELQFRARWSIFRQVTMATGFQRTFPVCEAFRESSWHEEGAGAMPAPICLTLPPCHPSGHQGLGETSALTTPPKKTETTAWDNANLMASQMTFHCEERR